MKSSQTNGEFGLLDLAEFVLAHAGLHTPARVKIIAPPKAVCAKETDQQVFLRDYRKAHFRFVSALERLETARPHK